MRAGRSSSSPPRMSAGSERRLRALGAVVVKLLILKTVAEVACNCKLQGHFCASHARGEGERRACGRYHVS